MYIKLLCDISYAICYTLKSLCNKCLNDGMYPQPLKEVKIYPLHKGKCDKSDKVTAIDAPFARIPTIIKC